MILDKLLEFDPTGTAITVTAVSTNVFDLHGSGLVPASSSSVRPGRDMGQGSDDGPTPRVLVLIGTSFVSAGGALLNVQFQGAPDDGTGGIGTYVTYAESGTLTAAQCAAGNTVFNIDWPRIQPLPNTPVLLPRFIRLNYVVTVSSFSAGKLQASVVLSQDHGTYYPPGLTIAN